MNIIIPSKNIYDLQNGKIKKNLIKKISVSAKSPSIEETIDKTVYSKSIDIPVRTYTGNSYLNRIKYNTSNQIFFRKEKYAYTVGEFEFESNYEKTYFKNLITSRTVISKTGRSKTGTYSLKLALKDNATISSDGYYTISDISADFSNYKITAESNGTVTFPEFPRAPYEDFKSYSGEFVPEETFEIEQIGANKYKAKYKILSGYEFYYLTRFETSISKAFPVGVQELNYTEQPYELYQTTTVTFDLVGSKYELKLNDETIDITSGSENEKEVFHISGNELIQTTNYIEDGDETKNAIKELYTPTLEKYKNGKETATLLCSISEYYDENGELAVSTKEMYKEMKIPIRSHVIPMIMNNKGEDVPMSKDKVFEVVGSEIYYDGAVWQKLTLLQV